MPAGHFPWFVGACGRGEPSPGADVAGVRWWTSSHFVGLRNRYLLWDIGDRFASHMVLGQSIVALMNIVPEAVPHAQRHAHTCMRTHARAHTHARACTQVRPNAVYDMGVLSHCGYECSGKIGPCLMPDARCLTSYAFLSQYLPVREWQYVDHHHAHASLGFYDSKYARDALLL